jgi:hypothetical protein
LQLTYLLVITISICWGVLVGEGNNLGSLVTFTQQENKYGLLKLEIVEINFNPLTIGFARIMSNSTIKKIMGH